MITNRLGERGFAALWAAAHLVGWGILALVLSPVMSDASTARYFVGGVLVFLLPGIAITVAQVGIFHYALGDTPHQWLSRSIGAHVVAVWLWFNIPSMMMTSVSPRMLFGLLFFLPGVAQWWSLRDGVPKSYWWLVAQGGVALLSVGLLMLDLVLWLQMAGIGIIHAAISTVAMWWLLRNARILR